RCCDTGPRDRYGQRASDGPARRRVYHRGRGLARRNAVATGGGGSRRSLGGIVAEAVGTTWARTAPAGSCRRRPSCVTQEGRPADARSVSVGSGTNSPAVSPKGSPHAPAPSRLSVV